MVLVPFSSFPELSHGRSEFHLAEAGPAPRPLEVWREEAPLLPLLSPRRGEETRLSG